MKFRTIATVLVALLLVPGRLVADEQKDEESRQKIRKMAAQTLQDLYKAEPTSKAAIQKSAGYAVFNNLGTRSCS